MNKKKNKHIGSSLDDFLKEEGMLEEIEEVVAKRIFVFQMEKEMKKQNLDKAALAEKMETSRSSVDRILDPESPSTLRSFAKAARALGCHLRISLACLITVNSVLVCGQIWLSTGFVNFV